MVLPTLKKLHVVSLQVVSLDGVMEEEPKSDENNVLMKNAAADEVGTHTQTPNIVSFVGLYVCKFSNGTSISLWFYLL